MIGADILPDQQAAEAERELEAVAWRAYMDAQVAHVEHPTLYTARRLARTYRDFLRVFLKPNQRPHSPTSIDAGSNVTPLRPRA